MSEEYFGRLHQQQRDKARAVMAKKKGADTGEPEISLAAANSIRFGPAVQAAANRIVLAVGQGDTFSQIDASALWSDIDNAGMWFRVRLTHKASGNAARRKKLEVLQSAALKMKTLMSDPDVMTDVSRHHPADPMEAIAGLLAAISDSIEYSTIASDPTSIAGFLGIDERSPFEWLAGVHLAEVYKRHFGEEARISRRDGDVASGPFVQFVSQVLVELGISNGGEPYKPEAIALALKIGRTGKVRRRTP